MKVLRFGGVAIVAILVATAAFGTKSATPTALCSTNPSGGACGAPIEKEAFIEGSTSKAATIVTGAGSISCSSSSIAMETTSGPAGKGVAVTGAVTSLGFGSCLLSGKACTVTTTNRPYLAQFQWTTGGNGELSFGNGGSGQPNLSVVCGTTIECAYTFESPLDIKGVFFASTITASSDSAGKGSGKTCPGTSVTWSAVYNVFEPEPFFVGDYVPTTQLCKKNETPCLGGEAYGSPVSFAAGLETGTKSKLKVKITEESEETEYAVQCETSTVEGKVSDGTLSMSGELTSISFGECGPTCSVKALKMPYAAKAEATGSGNGKIAFSKGGGGAAPRIRVRCIGAYKCTYESATVTPSISGGTPAKLVVSVTLSTKVAAESDEKCGSQVKWEASYSFTKPEAGGEAKMWVVREGI